MSLSKLRVLVMDKEAWHAAGHGVTRSGAQVSDWTDWKGAISKRVGLPELVWLLLGQAIQTTVTLKTNDVAYFIDSANRRWIGLEVPGPNFNSVSDTLSSSEERKVWCQQSQRLSLLLRLCGSKDENVGKRGTRLGKDFGDGGDEKLTKSGVAGERGKYGEVFGG